MKNLKQYFPDWISTAIILTAIVIVGVMSVECQESKEPPCGKERMPVKTLHDKDAKLIQWGTIKQATVAEVVRNAAPPNVRLKSSNDHRLAWEEKVVWQITGEIVGFKLEADQDFHVVIRDVKDHTKTMVVELVAPECIAEPYKSVTAQYRSILEMAFGKATHEFKYVMPERIVVTGPGFYDFIHGQKGAAPNGFEIHPVVQLEAEDDDQ